MKGVLKLWLNDLPDNTKKNFQLVEQYMRDQDVMKFDWKFTTFSVPAAVTNYKIPHNLGYAPTDILSTRTDGAITFLYSQFTDAYLFITTTGAVSFRGLIGRYKENKE